MLQGWVVVAIALLYIGFLFAVASYGDRAAARRRARGKGRGRPLIYSLSLAVYCTSWTFFGSVGLASTSGFDFLTIYIGPAVMIGLGVPIVIAVVRLAKAQNITSIADFIGSRYGKSQSVAAVVAGIALVGAVPYIALQLKAVSASLSTLAAPVFGSESFTGIPVLGDLALLVAVSMGLFAILFGTRHIDATEHQEGLMLAIATESFIKLVAFLLVGAFITWGMFDGLGDIWAQASAIGADAVVIRDLDGGTLITMTLLSFFCALLLPRQFHVTVVENNTEGEIRRAAWMFPLYLLLINLFVLPIALAGLITFQDGSVDGDMFVLALPMSAGAEFVTLAAFIGGLSAATAMVIVASVALAIMISNDIVMPVLLRRLPAELDRADIGRLLLNVRRAAILVIMMLAYAYYRVVGGTAALVEIGLVSFAAIAQFAPAFFGGLVWKRATARGAIAGLLTGFAVWAYTMLVPAFVEGGLLPASLLDGGPWGLAFLKPQMLFYIGFDPLVHAVFWSLTLNLLAYVLVSLLRLPEPIERVQAGLFVASDLAPLPPSFRLWRTSVTVGELQDTVARYIGEERTERAFSHYAASRESVLELEAEADVDLLRHCEHLLSSAIGAASSRLVLSLLLTRRNVSHKAALKLLDDASAALQHNRDLLQTALDHVRQGLAVFDSELQLVCWNRQFRDLLDLPPELAEVGAPLSGIVRFMAERGDLGPGAVVPKVRERLEQIVVRLETFQERFIPRGIVLEVRTARLPDGGLVATYTDITEKVRAAEALALANETLEGRVKERTEELTRLNAALGQAKADADAANISKTRFLAAAGHDILQPLNAARLYVTSLVERSQSSGGDVVELAQNVDSSLEAVEEIIGALLEISRLDTGAMEPELSAFGMGDILRQIKVEFEPAARAKGLDLVVVPSSLGVRSDRRLLRRLLQNLVSNAIKYTRSGRVLVGCRRRRGRIRIEVHDTGPGIPAGKHKVIFQEFLRLDEGARAARGLGLGLSIVERIGRMLGHPVELVSAPGRGTMFAVEVPLAARLDRPAGEAVAAVPAATRLDSLTVLCIDNEAKILDGMKALLGGWGCEVLTARSAREAIRLLRRTPRPPDILIVDYHLDEGDGIAATRALRRALRRDVPAVLATADRSPAVREAARHGGLAVLNKPVKPAALRALLAQWRITGAAAE